MDSISVSLLEDANIDSLEAFARSIWSVAYRDILSKDQISYMLSRLYRPDLLREQTSSGNPLFGAYCGAHLVGYAHLFIEGHQSRLDKLYIDTLYQGIGIGRKLMNEVVRFALACDCTLMTLRVNRANTSAVAAYERFGFEVVATSRKEIGGGYTMDDFVMLMDLPPAGSSVG